MLNFTEKVGTQKVDESLSWEVLPEKENKVISGVMEMF